MTDAHCHEPSSGVRSLLCAIGQADWPRLLLAAADGPVFFGVHPWQTDGSLDIAGLERCLEECPGAGVGEIGLDRLRSRDIPPAMREAFSAQLEIAANFGRPVVLHGAKCWGQVVSACKPFAERIPAFLFHGFSRSSGLLPEITAMNGFISVGPALLNDHAVNYRQFVKTIPVDRLLVESDRQSGDEGRPPTGVAEILCKLADLLGMTVDELEKITDANAEHFMFR